MLTLGVDPGTYRMGIGIIESSRGDLKFVHAEVISAKKGDSLPARLKQMHARLAELLTEFRPLAVAIEEPFVAKNAKAAMAIGHAQAVAMLAAESDGVDVSTYSPRAVKQAVTDYGASTKEQVQEMIKVLLHLDKLPTPLDASDALAVAICHINATHANRVILLP